MYSTGSVGLDCDLLAICNYASARRGYQIRCTFLVKRGALTSAHGSNPACIKATYGTSSKKLETPFEEKCPPGAPSASDALTAKLIEQAGFPAYQIGGFALDGMRFGFPDMDVNRLGEKSAVVRDIVHASDLPVLVDCDDGYGDEKNVTHTIRVYDDLGVSAVFIEDQKSPKKCGHMGGKHVVDPRDMVNKLKGSPGCAKGRRQALHSGPYRRNRGQWTG